MPRVPMCATRLWGPISVMAPTATSSRSATSAILDRATRPMTSMARTPVVPVCLYRRSCHLTSSACPCAVWDAGYGRVITTGASVGGASTPSMVYGLCVSSSIFVPIAAASGGAGWAALAQPCRHTVPVMPLSRVAVAGVGVGGLWWSPYSAPPLPRAGACLILGVGFRCHQRGLI